MARFVSISSNGDQPTPVCSLAVFETEEYGQLNRKSTEDQESEPIRLEHFSLMADFGAGIAPASPTKNQFLAAIRHGHR